MAIEYGKPRALSRHMLALNCILRTSYRLSIQLHMSVGESSEIQDANRG